jgi:transcriptional regulator with XRE-family HTH domain
VPGSLSNAFGRVIQRKRQEAGISQEKMAQNCGVHRTYLSKIELGKVAVSLEIAQRVAIACDEKLSELISQAETDLRSLAMRS